jgi:hypothetical protein
MGQKIHPHGLRVGITRKWNSSWFASGLEWKKLFFYQKEVENFFKVLFYYYPYTKISRRKRVLLFDVKLFKYNLSKIFIFIFFYKFRTLRRKDVRAVLTKQKVKVRSWKKGKNIIKKMNPLIKFNQKSYLLGIKSNFLLQKYSNFIKVS